MSKVDLLDVIHLLDEYETVVIDKAMNCEWYAKGVHQSDVDRARKAIITYIEERWTF